MNPEPTDYPLGIEIDFLLWSLELEASAGCSWCGSPRHSSGYCPLVHTSHGSESRNG